MKRGLNGIFSGSGPNAITTSATLSGIDLVDLSRGEGEWRNMQDIIRRSFRILFEQIESQQGQINSLTESYNTLKKDQLKKMDISDMNSYFDSKMVTYARAASIDDVNTLRGHITELRSNLERKANIRYVDDLLQRKANKSDLIMHQPQGQSSGVNLSSQLIEQINSKMYSMEQRMASMETMVKLSSEHENTLIKHQLHEVRSQLLGKVDKRDLETAMLTRVERTEFDLQLHQKVDRNHLNEVRYSMHEV